MGWPAVTVAGLCWYGMVDDGDACIPGYWYEACGEWRVDGDWKAPAEVAEGGIGGMCDVSNRANEGWGA